MAQAAIETRELTKRYGRGRGFVDVELRGRAGSVSGEHAVSEHPSGRARRLRPSDLGT